MKNYILGIPAGLLILAALFWFIEAGGAVPHHELEPATVLKVQADWPSGFVGQKFRTTVKFADGFVTDVGGDKGEPGDKILAYRQRGVDTPFGVLARRN